MSEDDKKPTYSFWPQLPKLVCVSCAHFTRGMCLEHNKPVKMTEQACGDFKELDMQAWGQDE